MPESKIETVSSLCSLMPRPHLMTGLLRQWLIQHFSADAILQQPELRGLLWTAMPGTEMLIESSTNWKPQDTENRPAIIIKRNSWEPLPIAIDNRKMGLGRTATHYEILIKGSHTLFCISNKGVEAEILGGEVYKELMQFGPIVRQNLDLKKFSLVEVGALAKLEEARENYAVPVTIAYCFSEAWKLTPHLPLMKQFSLSALLP